MPFRMVLANPFALAALTAIAIGVITYQILSNRRKIPTRGRIGYRGDNNNPYGPDGFDKPDKSPPGKPDKSPKEFSSHTGENEAVKVQPKSVKSNNESSGLRKRSVATQSPDSATEAGKSDLSSNLSQQSQSTAQQSNETQRSGSNIGRVNAENNFVANINDEDSDSESNNSLVDMGLNKSTHRESSCSSGYKNFRTVSPTDINREDSDSDSSNNSLDSAQNDKRRMGLNKNTFSESSSPRRYKNIRTPSPTDSEKIYKRDVCNYLKTDVERDDFKKKCLENFSDEESDISEKSSSPISDDSSCCVPKKPIICKGCLEEFANAVAYPCKHCYLCLDCAIKVHRIYNKCSICLSVIKTFEQLKM